MNTGGPAPFVERVHFSSARPFRMMMVARIERFDFFSAYAPLPDGRPFPTGTGGDMAGSLLGKAGTLTTRTRYGEAHVVR